MIALLLGSWIAAGGVGRTVPSQPPRQVSEEAAVATRDEKRSFWNQPRKGANCQNRSVAPDYWRAARAAGIEFVRLIPDAWPAHQRDFLIGNADGYVKLDSVDLARLRQVLDDAHAAGVRVVLAMASLPGARWKPLNGDRDDARVWREFGFRMQGARFWRDLAGALRDHPAIVAYDPLNEPHPERAFGLVDPDSAAFRAWYARARGTLADLNAFHRNVMVLIRESDPRTPIMVGGWCYASAAGLTYLEPVNDPGVLYSFHEHEPWDALSPQASPGHDRHPGRPPGDRSGGGGIARAARIRAWAVRYGIPPTRIVAAEFGVDRRADGAARDLAEAIGTYRAEGWHWAFYAFRQDDPGGRLDYELGTEPLGDAYWQAIEHGADPEPLKRRHPNALWRVIARELSPPTGPR